MEKGEWFRVASRPGQVYQYQYIFKGDVIAFGGDKNPKARRQYEAFSPKIKLIPCAAPFRRKDEVE